MTVQTINIPYDSLILDATPDPHYEDCFEINFTPLGSVILDEIVFRSFGNFSSGWVELLIRLRNILVKPFGLKTSGDEIPISDYRKVIVKGEQVGFFKAVEKSENEVLLYAEDIHLEAFFCVSIEKQHKNITLRASTTVNFSNRFGRIYLSIIKPFHILIIKNMLKKIAKHYTQPTHLQPSSD